MIKTISLSVLFFIGLLAVSLIINQLLALVIKGTILNYASLVIVPMFGIKAKNKYMQNASYLYFFVALLFFLLYLSLPLWSKIGK